MDSRGIEPRTTHMLSEYYTTKPQAHLVEEIMRSVNLQGAWMFRSVGVRVLYIFASQFILRCILRHSKVNTNTIASCSFKLRLVLLCGIWQGQN